MSSEKRRFQLGTALAGLSAIAYLPAAILFIVLILHSAMNMSPWGSWYRSTLWQLTQEAGHPFAVWLDSMETTFYVNHMLYIFPAILLLSLLADTRARHRVMRQPYQKCPGLISAGVGLVCPAVVFFMVFDPYSAFMSVFLVWMAIGAVATGVCFWITFFQCLRLVHRKDGAPRGKILTALAL